MRFCFSLLFLLVSVITFPQAKEPFKVTDLLKVKSAGSVTASRDGSTIVFTVTAIEADPENKWEHNYVTSIWMMNPDGTGLRQLTGKESASQPAISPDGKKLAFVRNTGGRPQIFVLSMDGGEAVQYTKYKYGASAPRWSPDGKKILFNASIPMKDLLKDTSVNMNRELPAWSFERPGFAKNENLKTNSSKPDPDGNINEIRAYLENNVTDKKARVVNKLNFQDETDVNPDLSFNHLFIIDAKPDAKPVKITSGFYRNSIAVFTPDGNKIVFISQIDSLEHPDRSLESQVYIMNTDGSGLTKLLGEKNKAYNQPVVSPSGKTIAFLYSGTGFVSVPELGIMSLSSPGTIRTIPFDRNVSSMTWSPDEKFIYFTAQSNGGAPLYKLNVEKGHIRQLTRIDEGIGSYALARNNIVFVKTNINSPFEVFISDTAGKNHKQVTELNAWVKNRKLSIPEKHSFVNEKGLTVEYWVMKPVDFLPGKKYPMLLEIHGGPSSMWGPGESSMWHEYQYFTSKGYGVVYSNPRGSGGYGETFLRANINDWGKGPTSDVLTALDKAVAEGWADTSKLMVTGGSYAGYLVTWILAHDQRFAAACAQRGVYDLATFFGEGNAWRLVPNYFGGYPWEKETRANLFRESPIHYVENIHTPLIIFHGENDRRTGVIQSEMMYRSLKALNRPVEYVRHPTATHEITRSGNNRQRIDQMLRTYEFFERFIR